MNIYSFHHKLYNSIHHIKEIQIVEKWKESWSRYGWNPIVLGMDDIVKDELYYNFLNVVKKFPTTNTVLYELICWLRWFCWSRVDDDLFACGDYDVINYGFTPEMVGNEPTLQQEFYFVPDCVVHSKETIFKFVNIIENKVLDNIDKYGYNYIVDGNRIIYHISDMSLTEKLIHYKEFPIKKYLKEGIFREIYTLSTGLQSLYPREQPDLNAEWVWTEDVFQNLKDSEKKHCKSKIKKYWKSGNILHYSNAANHYFADIFKDELPKDFVKTPLDRKINKCDILEYIEKEIIGV